MGSAGCDPFGRHVGALRRPVGPRRRVAQRRGAERPVASSPLPRASGSLGASAVAFLSYALRLHVSLAIQARSQHRAHTGARTLSVFCTVCTHLACSC